MQPVISQFLTFLFGLFTPTGLLAFLFFLLGNLGCSVADTGPNTVRQALTTTGAVAQSTLSAFQPKDIQAGARGQVTNPRYDFYTFVGSGVFIWAQAGVSGIDVQGQIMASGQGVDIPESVRLEAAKVANSDLPPDVKNERIAELMMNFLKTYQPLAPAKKEPDSMDDVSSGGEPSARIEDSKRVARTSLFGRHPCAMLY